MQQMQQVDVTKFKFLLRQTPGVSRRVFVTLGDNNLDLMPKVAVDVDGISTFNGVVGQLGALYKRNWGVPAQVKAVYLVEAETAVQQFKEA